MSATTHDLLRRDPMKCPHFIRSQKRLPDSGLRDNHMQGISGPAIPRPRTSNFT